MTNLFPGAEWRPMPGQEKRTKRRKGRGVIFHVAVYTGASIYNINLGTGNDAHLYVRKDGTVEQNVDLDVVAYAAVDANPTMVMVETAGGMGTSAQVNAEPWTPQQVETLAQIAAYLNRTEGAPLQVMIDSKPTSRGIAVHRWGISPWRIAGGEKWSGVNGKECPGNAKIAQVSTIAALARQIAGGQTAAAVAPTPTVSEEDDDMPTYPYLGYRSDPAQHEDDGRVGDGTMVLAAPGVWDRVETPLLGKLYVDQGLVKEYVDIRPDSFRALRDKFLKAAPKASA